MEIISARDFRANQGRLLAKAKSGESVLLTSRMGTFRIVPITEEDNLADRITQGLKEAKLIRSGKMPKKKLEDILDEI